MLYGSAILPATLEAGLIWVGNCLESMWKTTTKKPIENKKEEN